MGGGQHVLREFCYPEQSAGLIYACVTEHLGFRFGQEGKTMGLAPYGRPDLYEVLRKHLVLRDDGGFQFLPVEQLREILRAYVPRRRSVDAPLLLRHQDVAFAGQSVLEQIVANAWGAALRLTGQDTLVVAGGVALNSVANETAFRAARPARLYISPNPGDTGHALGAALLGAYEIAGWPARTTELTDYLGPTYSHDEISEAVRASGADVTTCSEPERLAAQVIANGHILARFDGRAEFGPRALGNRSILCDPRRSDMKDFLNARVKHREAFRPFAPSVLEEEAGAWFDSDQRNPYMLRVVSVLPGKRSVIPAVVHVDGSGRVQTVGAENRGYRKIIEAFRDLTGVPLVLNTSFNVDGQPIVETPAQAVACFLGTEIDVLAIGVFLLSKKPLDVYLRTERTPQ